MISRISADFELNFSILLAERHHFRLPVVERVKRFVGFVAGASASKALTAWLPESKRLWNFGGDKREVSIFQGITPRLGPLPPFCRIPSVFSFPACSVP